jgi:DNA-binding HxlR family transcriptional regulator
MKKKCLSTDACPLARGYDAIGDWWSLLIITRMLLLNLRRFTEIQESLGTAKNILTARLRKLVEAGIVERIPASDGSAYYEYILTSKGKGLFKVIVALRQWGEENFPCAEGEAFQLMDRANEQVVPPIELRSVAGDVLGPDDLIVRPAGAGVG